MIAVIDCQKAGVCVWWRVPGVISTRSSGHERDVSCCLGKSAIHIGLFPLLGLFSEYREWG